MAEIPLESAIERISRELTLFERNQITGAKLGQLIRKVAPEINVRELMNVPVGAGALTKFAEKYLSTVLHRGDSTTGDRGGDPVYTINESLRSKSPFGVGVSPALWTTFVSPNHEHVLLLDVDHDSLIAVKKNDEGPAGAAKIDSLTSAELSQLATEFLQSVTDPATQAALTESLGRTKSYTEWLNVLRSASGKEYQRWAIFRRKRIEDLFVTRLQALSPRPNDEKIEKILHALKASQSEANRQRILTGTQRRYQFDQALHAAASDASPDETFRSVFAAATSRMTVNQLRQVPLPFGAVFDAFADRFKQ